MAHSRQNFSVKQLQSGTNNCGYIQQHLSHCQRNPSAEMVPILQLSNFDDESTSCSSINERQQRRFNQPLTSDKISDCEIERKSITWVTEFLKGLNSEDGITKNILTFYSDKNFHIFVKTAVHKTLADSNYENQLSVGRLLTDIFDKKLFTSYQFYRGLEKILQSPILADCFPKFFNTMGNILSPFYVNLDDASRKEFFNTVIKCCTPAIYEAKLMCYVLKMACLWTSQIKIGALWRSAGWNWSDFLSNNENEKEFIEKNDLKFTTNPSLQEIQYSRLKNKGMFFDEILRKVQTKSSNINDDLIDFIEIHIENTEVKFDPNFVSELVKAVVHGCVNSIKINGETSYLVDQKKLESNCNVLAKYCDHEEERETKCLYTLQKLSEKLEHPSELLNTIFITLYNQNVISLKAYLNWESTDLASPGKAVAVLSVKRFLNQLKKTNDVSEVNIDMFQQLSKPPKIQRQGGSQRSNRIRSFLDEMQHDRILPTLNQDVKFHTVDNPWKSQIGKLVDTCNEKTKSSELMKAFRGILNKLTPQNFHKLLDEVKKLKIDTEERLQGILELIFDKAVNESEYCSQYAILCKHLATCLIAVNISSDENEVEKELRFTPLLISRCQKEFESKMYEGIDVEGKQAVIEQTTEEENKKLLHRELEEEKRKARNRSLGNMKLIGELYLLGMLKSNIMLSCIERLLRDSEEESLECLCTLLRTIGSKLESDVKDYEMKKSLKKDAMLSLYFNTLYDYVNEKKTSARVRFMIQDVLEMRQNGWKARKIQDENKPKTIDEIHSEAQEEKKKQTLLLQQHSQQKRQESMKKSGDWKKQSSKDVNMMLKNLKNTSTEHGNMQFGPGNFGGLWSQGARGGSQQKQESQMRSNRQMQSRPAIQQRDLAKVPSSNLQRKST